MVARLTPPLDELDRLSPESVFTKVAELGSFRRAALVLGLHPALVATTVRALERRRGRPLLARAGGSFTLLPDGAALLRSLQGESSVGDVIPTTRCVLDVSVCASESRLLLHALPLFAARYPHVEVRLYSSFHDLAASPREAVLRLGEPGAIANDYEVLGTYRIVTCASPGYLADHGLPTSLDALAGHRSIPATFDAIELVRPLRFRSGNAPCDVTLAHTIAAADIATQLAAAAAGLGITQVPLTREVRGLLAHRRLVPILEAYEPDGVPILLGHRSDVPPAFAALRDWLVDLYRSECLALSPRR
jgi:LysR family transcriptional regulator for bpeEF and oprC